MRTELQAVRCARPIWIAAVFLVLLCAAGTIRAQDTAKLEPTKKMAKDADPDWEVATVKPSDPNDRNDSFDVEGRHIVIENHTVEQMLLIAYGVQKNQIVNAPDWAGTEHFDVNGFPNLAGEPNMKQFQHMLQKLLVERFGMKLHHEQREMPVFALTLAKGGPKLAKSTHDPNDLPDQNGGGDNGRQSDRFTNFSMPELGLILLFYVDRPVVDQTGLEGRYDFQLKWLTDDNRAADPGAPPGLFTAIQEQLGLKLEPVKALADVLVIDKLERPGAN